MEYENSDKARYTATLYVLRLNEYPKIKLDNESNGILVISKDNFKDYMNVQNINSLQLHECWKDTISKVLGIE